MMPYRFTCLIPAYNEADRIGGVLAAIAAHPNLHHVIVIDDGSTDLTAQVARSFGVMVLTTSAILAKPQLWRWACSTSKQVTLYCWMLT